MKISKIFFLVILAGFLLVGFCYIRNHIRYQKEKAAWEARVEVLQEEIAELEREIGVHLTDADKWRDRAFEKTEELKVMERRLVEAERRHSEVLASIAELAPDELVLQARYFLNVLEEDIVLTPQGVVFSIETTRQLITDLTDYEFQISKKVPDLEAQVKKVKSIVDDVNMENVELRGAVDKLILDRDKWKEMYYGEHKLRLASENTYSLFSTKNLVTGAVVAAIVWGVITFMK